MWLDQEIDEGQDGNDDDRKGVKVEDVADATEAGNLNKKDSIDGCVSRILREGNGAKLENKRWARVRNRRRGGGETGNKPEQQPRSHIESGRY